ncbi:SdrH family protein, partial [Staphylococcus haemolyticus]|uniref:SdrH family protein n=1 Tax=Staphylococcus haemolyticus TaxID=1283 RepID=UPI001F0A5809
QPGDNDSGNPDDGEQPGDNDSGNPDDGEQPGDNDSGNPDDGEQPGDNDSSGNPDDGEQPGDNDSGKPDNGNNPGNNDSGEQDDGGNKPGDSGNHQQPPKHDEDSGSNQGDNHSNSGSNNGSQNNSNSNSNNNSNYPGNHSEHSSTNDTVKPNKPVFNNNNGSTSRNQSTGSNRHNNTVSDSMIHQIFPHMNNGNSTSHSKRNQNQSIMSGSNTNQWHYGDNLQQNHRQSHIETYSNNDNMQSEVLVYSKSMLLNRLNSLATGSYKYNPYIINQVNRLGNNNEYISNQDFYRLFRKQSFNNEYLDYLQKGSNYFRFEYFNPLNSKKYYKNLDEQVLALITGEIGSMPELKKPSDRDKKEDADIQSHDDDKIIDTNEKSKEAENKDKYKNINIALITSIIMIFVGVTGRFIYRKIKN